MNEDPVNVALTSQWHGTNLLTSWGFSVDGEKHDGVLQSETHQCQQQVSTKPMTALSSVATFAKRIGRKKPGHVSAAFGNLACQHHIQQQTETHNDTIAVHRVD